MTWAQAQGWLSQMTAYMQQRAAERAYLTPGSGVEINGGVIALDAPFREEPEAAPEPTWGVQIWMRYRFLGTAAGSQADADVWKVMAFVSLDGAVISNLGPETLSFYDFPESEDREERAFQQVDLEMSVRSYESGITQTYEESLYRVPVRLTLAVMRRLDDETYVEDSTEDFILRRASQQRLFSAKQRNTFYDLRVKSITKI